MRCVIDTNILISALGWDGKERKLVRTLIERRFEVVSSPWLIEEFRHAALQPRMDFTESEIGTFLEGWLNFVQVVVPKESIAACRDADDNNILECAIEGGADYIITGDRDLLDMADFRGIAILSAADFLKRL
jgi:uncharacterized protein